MKQAKVIGIGLNKTGTTTLAKALHILGYNKHLSCSYDLLKEYREGRIEKVLDIMDDFTSFEDWPFPLLYKEIFYKYGENARYVLTKRKSEHKWLESLKWHSLNTSPTKHCRKLAYNYNYPHGREQEHLKLYNAHNKEVVEFFNKNNANHLLLEVSWDSGDGWQKLCGFLDAEVPNVPFPHANKARKNINWLIMLNNLIRIQLEKK